MNQIKFFHWVIFILFKMCSSDDQMVNFIFNKNKKKTFIFLSFSFKTSLIPPCLPYTPPTPYFYSSSYPF